MADPKRLYRSKANRVVAGVCGGLGDYFSLDPVLFRILFVALTLVGGSGILLYIVLIFVIPEEGVSRVSVEGVVNEVKDSVQKTAQEVRDNPRWFDNRRNLIAGLIILVGVVSLLNQFTLFSWLSWNVFWPIVIIGVGVLLIAKRR